MNHDRNKLYNLALYNPVTRCGKNYAWMQITQDFQNNGKPGWTGKSSFVFKVPRRYLNPSIIYSVPSDWIMQRTYTSFCFMPHKPVVNLKEGSLSHN